MACIVGPEILAALAQGPKTAAALRLVLGRSVAGVGVALAALREAKQVHISGWQLQCGKQGRRAPVYALGNLPDVPEPPVEPQAVRNRRNYWKKVAARQAVKNLNPWQGLAR